MKKLLSIIFAFILIFSCFAVSSFAEDMPIVDVEIDEDVFYEEDIYDTYNYPIYDKQPIIRFSDDYTKLYVDGEPFSRVNMSMLSTDFAYTVVAEDERDENLRSSAYLELTDEQRKNLNDIYIEVNLATSMYRIEFYYDDGSSLTVYFLEDSYLEDYNNVISGNSEHYLIDFVWPDGNIVTAEKSALFGEPVTFNGNDLLDLYDFYYVTASNSDGTISISAGLLFAMNDEFYYLDYAEMGIDETDFFFDYYENGSLTEFTVHKLTDEILLADLQEAEQRYYEDDYGILYDDDTTDTISAVFLIFVFAVIPAVIFVIFLIKAIRGKGIYKKIYGAVAAFCIAELAVFTIIAVIISNLN